MSMFYYNNNYMSIRYNKFHDHQLNHPRIIPQQSGYFFLVIFFKINSGKISIKSECVKWFRNHLCLCPAVVFPKPITTAATTMAIPIYPIHPSICTRIQARIHWCINLSSSLPVATHHQLHTRTTNGHYY